MYHQVCTDFSEQMVHDFVLKLGLAIECCQGTLNGVPGTMSNMIFVKFEILVAGSFKISLLGCDAV
jgi:hypothetical protein